MAFPKSIDFATRDSSSKSTPIFSGSPLIQSLALTSPTTTTTEGPPSPSPKTTDDSLRVNDPSTSSSSRTTPSTGGSGRSSELRAQIDFLVTEAEHDSMSAGDDHQQAPAELPVPSSSPSTHHHLQQSQHHRPPGHLTSPTSAGADPPSAESPSSASPSRRTYQRQNSYPLSYPHSPPPRQPAHHPDSQLFYPQPAYYNQQQRPPATYVSQYGALTHQYVYPHPHPYPSVDNILVPQVIAVQRYGQHHPHTLRGEHPGSSSSSGGQRHHQQPQSQSQQGHQASHSHHHAQHGPSSSSNPPATASTQYYPQTPDLSGHHFQQFAPPSHPPPYISHGHPPHGSSSSPINYHHPTFSHGHPFPYPASSGATAGAHEQSIPAANINVNVNVNGGGASAASPITAGHPPAPGGTWWYLPPGTQAPPQSASGSAYRGPFAHPQAPPAYLTRLDMEAMSQHQQHQPPSASYLSAASSSASDGFGVAMSTGPGALQIGSSGFALGLSASSSSSTAASGPLSSLTSATSAANLPSTSVNPGGASSGDAEPLFPRHPRAQSAPRLNPGQHVATTGHQHRHLSHQQHRDQPSSGTSSGQGHYQHIPSPERKSKEKGKEKETPMEDATYTRRSYHPNPPTKRSDWVMWVGNVPSDATHDEVWRFFSVSAEHFVATKRISRKVHPPGGRGRTGWQHSQYAAMGSSSGDADQSEGSTGENGSDSELWGGVSSVFLISRSNCAFVNFDTERHLICAVAHFNGEPLRPRDPRCPRLVCRVRKKDDDLRAGVGGQRGVGMHTRWVKEKKRKAALADSTVTNTTTTTSAQRGSGEGGSLHGSAPGGSGGGSSSGGRPSNQMDDSAFDPSGSSSRSSLASTNSSFLGRHFPKRFFILKSLSVVDLNLSVETGTWATQPHNEGILDQAYRTSKEVFLVFSANKSGEFFGYARMAGPIVKERRVSWVSESDHTGSSRSQKRSGGSSYLEPIEDNEETDDRTGNFGIVKSPQRPSVDHEYTSASATMMLTSPGSHQVHESPAPLTPGTQAAVASMSKRSGPSTQQESYVNMQHRQKGPPVANVKRHLQSAPAELGPAHRKVSYAPEPSGAETLDAVVLRKLLSSVQVASGATYSTSGTKLPTDPNPSFLLDPQGPLRAVRESSESSRSASADGKPVRPSPTPLQPSPGSHHAPGRGSHFKVEWIRTTKLPFHRTRHLRNPFNHDREVKVSRDGTEIEPDCGQALLDEWDRPEAEPTPAVIYTGGPRNRGPGTQEWRSQNNPSQSYHSQSTFSRPAHSHTDGRLS